MAEEIGGKISVSDLQRKLGDPDVASEDLAKYLSPDPARSLPGKPAFKMNEATVDVPEQARRARLLGIDLDSWNRRETLRRQRDFERRVAQNPRQIRLLSEGDSWFLFPVWLFDIIDNLMQDYPIYDVSAAGDTLKNMADGLDNLEELIATKKPHGFLFSGGGNDIAGPEFEGYLKGYDPSFTAKDYLSVNFESFMRDVEARYNTLLRRLTRKFPELRIFCHGYDWVIPRPTGTFGVWLWPSLEHREVPAELRPQILAVMIDRFNDMLKRQAQLFEGHVIYVDCRGVVTPQRWFDELHPINPGYADISKKFKTHIQAALGALV